MKTAKKMLNSGIKPCVLPSGSNGYQIFLMLDPSIFILS
jgi:hypothetical protein